MVSSTTSDVTLIIVLSFDPCISIWPSNSTYKALANGKEKEKEKEGREKRGREEEKEDE